MFERNWKAAARAGARAIILGALLCTASSITIARAQTAPPDAMSTTPAASVKVPQVVVKEPKDKAKKRKAVHRPVPAQTAQPAAAPAQPPAQIANTPLGIGNPTGQIVTNLGAERYANTPVFSVTDLLNQSPGISTKQGNGPRDMGVSIRGSNARNGFGIRNIKVYDDGFPVTQPDGLSRSDLIDPHAYSGVDVYRGPSSVLFGNYATGGAINFRTFPGGELNGVNYGVEGGSFGYINNYVQGGFKRNGVEASVFMSDVRGDGYMSNSTFNTQTINGIASARITPNDVITFKVIDNELYGRLPVRQSLNQYKINPYQKGCDHGAALAPGCGSVNLFVNGYGGTRIPLSAEEAGLHRHDRRTIAGVRLDHDFNNDTTLRTQFVFDDKDYHQPTSSTAGDGDAPAYNVMSDLTNKGSLFGFKAVHTVGGYYNSVATDGYSYNVMPGGDGKLGKLTSLTSSAVSNEGVHAHDEIYLTKQWIAGLGIAYERSQLNGTSRSYTYDSNGVQTAGKPITADRDIENSAKEASLTFRPNDVWQIHGRVAEGYGIPQVSNLFVTPEGKDGNNTQLQPQTNVGYDLGVDWKPAKNTKISLTGFYEFFENELVSQSPGVGLKTYTFNAPRSEHRGIEAGVDVALTSNWRITAAYTYVDQVYTEYTERLSGGGKTAAFDRAGNKIPGISPNEATAQLRYEVKDGPYKGFGGILEYQWKDGFYMDNANFLKAPGYELVNLNLHYNYDVNSAYISKIGVFFEVKNIFDETYLGSANNIPNTLISGTTTQTLAGDLAKTTGSIYAGAPRTFLSGVKVNF